jgi:hypothetical protein
LFRRDPVNHATAVRCPCAPYAGRSSIARVRRLAGA